ncbi:la-related protein 1C [Lactuca sativa]|uniref:HTH La-type RNA-binding domain-containing protein n=1 Tax=Lactuca sativa TaxID=4236 RepID=A0A9R1UN35_LACSA|nr:la-related protein 1C [Lactuca sativa]KAJ0190520.1 hypothetical protein LSAT_V11C800400950 [Lactuca sativa]
MMADSSTGSGSTITHSGDGGGSGVNSPSSRRSLPSPWAQVVRGMIEPDSVPSSFPSPGVSEQNPVVTDPVTVVEVSAETPSESSNDINTCNAGGVKKSAWNKPSVNGVVEGTTTPVMGAASWPALSESTRPGMRSFSASSSSESSSTPTSDGSLAVSQAPVASQPRPNQVKPNANNVHPVRQRQIRRGGGASTGYNGRQPLPPPFPLYDVFGNLVPAVPNSTPAREQPLFKENNWSPRTVGGAGQQNRRNNNFGPRPRGGGGPYVNNGYGGRRDHHDRDWRGPRNHGPRDVRMQHQIAPPPPLPRGYIPPPHPALSPFIPPPYGAPMAYDMAASYVYLPTLPSEPYRGPPVLPPQAPPPVPMFVPVINPPLNVKIVKQIEYYFSDDNLVKDDFLRSNMDDEGWVPITLIAGFPRVQSLTNDIHMILNSLRDSSIVEIQGEKIRSRDWRRWMNVPNRFQSTMENLIEEGISIQNLTMEDDRSISASSS